MPSSQGANIAGGAIAGAGAGFQMGGPYGAIAGAVIGGVLGALEKNPTLQLERFNPADVTYGQKEFLGQREHIGDVSNVLSQANKIDNASYQKDASEFAPHLMGNIAQQSANTASLLHGNLSPGVQAALGKPGATARDLGLTSNQLMQQGAANLLGETKLATSLNPFNETSMDTLLSPSALLQRKDQNDLYNLNVRNQQTGARFANAASNDWARQAMGMLTSMSPTGGIGKGIAGAGGAPAGQGYQYSGPMGYASDGSYTTMDDLPTTPPVNFDDGGLSNSYNFGWG